MPALHDDFVLYNDLVTNHTRLPKGCDVTKVPAPVANKNVSRAFVYDEYTKTMWVVGAAGKLINADGRLLTLDGYRAYWAQSVYSKDHC